MKSVLSYSTSGREKEGIRERMGISQIRYKCVVGAAIVKKDTYNWKSEFKSKLRRDFLFKNKHKYRKLLFHHQFNGRNSLSP